MADWIWMPLGWCVGSAHAHAGIRVLDGGPDP